MKALIFDGQIVDVSPVAFPVVGALSWVDCPADTDARTHYFDAGTVKVKPPKSQAEIDAETTAAALLKIKAAALEVLPDLVAYVASKADAPDSVKLADTAIKAEKTKVK